MNTEKIKDTIKAEIRKDIKKRMPSDFDGLFNVTLQHLTKNYAFYDKYKLRQILVSEIIERFSKRLSEKDTTRLRKIWQDTDRQQQNSNFERDMFNDSGSYLTTNKN